MASKTFRFAANYVNRNPRNVELLGIQQKPSGWQLEKDSHLRSFIYKVELIQGKAQQVGRVVHNENGVVLEASTAEPAIAQQLYSRVDTSAALNIGRVLARRCLQSGIHFVMPCANNEQRKLSEHQGAFFSALEEGGLRLEEPQPIQQNQGTDSRSTWKPYPIKHTREDKLDELPGYY